MNVGYVGLGNMGSPLAARLAPGGDLTVFDLNEAAVDRLIERGARGSSGLVELASKSDVVLLCLPTSAEVRTAVFGDGGLREGMRKGTLLIDQTSGDPRETRAMAAELVNDGVELIDAPVSGGPARAEEGTITIMVGSSDEQYDRALPLLSRVSSNVRRAGAVGDGHLVKLVNNMISGMIRWATIEGVALAAKYGVSPHRAVEIMSTSGAKNDYMDQVMGPEVLKGNLSVGFSVGLAHKDLRIACELGEEASVPLLVGNLTREIYQMCISEMGYDARVDSTAVMMDRMAGTHMVPPDAV
jgi:3-hydroxyisobutyrate dehydrogenase